MSKSKVVAFNKEQLRELIEDKNSCVTVHKSFYNLALYPYHLTSLTSSIKDILNAGVAKYDKKLDGILLGYKNVNILTPQGVIVTDSCYIHVDIEADFYIFKPEVGATLTGIVNKKSRDHVGCLVHRIFNVSVPNKSEDESWPGYNVEIGQEVFLQVTYMNLDARLPYIRTSFILTKSKKKKRKSKTSDEVDVANGDNKIEEFKLNKRPVLNNEDHVNVQASKKKKKKSKEVKNKDEINNVANTVLDTTAGGKTEKRKKRKSRDKNDSLANVNISAEEEKMNNVLNSTLDLSEALESHKKKKRKSKENSVTFENLDITEELAKVRNVQDISVNTNAEVKTQKKKKRKSVDASNISVNLSTNSTALSNTPNTKVNGIDTDLQALRKSLLAEQLANLNQLETPKNPKKIKRKSDEFNAGSNTNNNERNIQSEVRRSKKRKSSFSENMSEDNPALRDSYANTTIDDCYSSSKKKKKNKHKNSDDKSELDTVINTSTVIETSNKKRKRSMSESEETELKKKKRKHSLTGNQNESQDLDNSGSSKKKHKSKKSKHNNVQTDN